METKVSQPCVKFGIFSFKSEKSEFYPVSSLIKKSFCFHHFNLFVSFQEESPTEDLDWVESCKKRQKVVQNAADLPEKSGLVEKRQKQVEILKNEGISLIERNLPWQAIGRWDEALEIKVPGKSAKNCDHEKLLEMKAQALNSLHEWEPAIEAAKLTLKIDPDWFCAHQTLGRSYLGCGQLQEAVNVRTNFFPKKILGILICC